MKELLEIEIKNRLESDFKKIAELVPFNKETKMYIFWVSPYISGTMAKIEDDLYKYGSELKMTKYEINNWVAGLAFPLKKKYFDY